MVGIFDCPVSMSLQQISSNVRFTILTLNVSGIIALPLELQTNLCPFPIAETTARGLKYQHEIFPSAPFLRAQSDHGHAAVLLDTAPVARKPIILPRKLQTVAQECFQISCAIPVLALQRSREQSLIKEIARSGASPGRPAHSYPGSLSGKAAHNPVSRPTFDA